jgi:hypothetical protein
MGDKPINSALLAFYLVKALADKMPGKPNALRETSLFLDTGRATETHGVFSMWMILLANLPPSPPNTLLDEIVLWIIRIILLVIVGYAFYRIDG